MFGAACLWADGDRAGDGAVSAAEKPVRRDVFPDLVGLPEGSGIPKEATDSGLFELSETLAFGPFGFDLVPPFFCFHLLTEIAFQIVLAAEIQHRGGALRQHQFCLWPGGIPVPVGRNRVPPQR